MLANEATKTKPRLAASPDEPEILKLLHLMHAEGGMLPLDVECARDFFKRAFDKKGGIIGVIDGPDGIHAMIMLSIGCFWYTRDNHLEEVFNYVRPDCRGEGHAKALIAFAKECADEIHIPLVIGVLTNARMEAKVRLYRQVLGTPAGAFFVYGAKWTGGVEPGNEDFWRKAGRGRGRRLAEAARKVAAG